jgi:hypothetical protein
METLIELACRQKVDDLVFTEFLVYVIKKDLCEYKECVFYRQRNIYSYFYLYLHDMFRPHMVIFRCINTGVKNAL